MNKTTLSFSLLLAVAPAFANPSATTLPHYNTAHRYAVPGNGPWDLLAVDEQGGRVFIAHGTIVQAIDVNTGAVKGVISETNGAHGIALAASLGKGFVACGKDNTVVAFNLATLAVLARIAITGENPDAIVYEPSLQRVFVFNGHSENVTVLNARTHAVIGLLPLAGKPELAVGDDHGTVYVNIEDKNMVAEIDGANLSVKHYWPVAPAQAPTGIALDRTTHRLFIAGTNAQMTVINTQSGERVASVRIGERVDGLAFDPALNRIYSANGEGTLTVIQEHDANTYSTVAVVPTQKGARTLAIDGVSHHLFLPTAQFGATPVATDAVPRPRPTIMPGTFVVLDVTPAD